MKPPPAHAASHCVDIGEMTQIERHAVIFARLEALHPGQHLRLLYDSDPQLLRDRFNTRFDGQYEWLDMKAGPLVWRVQITRLGTNARCLVGRFPAVPAVLAALDRGQDAA